MFCSRVGSAVLKASRVDTHHCKLRDTIRRLLFRDLFFGGFINRPQTDFFGHTLCALHEQFIPGTCIRQLFTVLFTEVTLPV